MKKLLLVFGLAIATVASASLTSSKLFAKDNALITVIQDEQSKEITVDDLPDAVKKAWDESKDDGDTVKKVYKVTKDDEVSYKIEYSTSSGDTKTIKFDAEGNELD